LHNRALVLQRVASDPNTTRARIAVATGLTRSTVSTLIEELVAAGLVIELEPGPVERGRPGHPLQLNPRGPAGLGVEINVDYVCAAVIDLTGVVRARRTDIVDNRARSARAAMRHAAKLVAGVRAEAKLPVAGAALAVPGLVDPERIVRQAPNLPQWQGTDPSGELERLIGVPVVAVDNEANLAAQAEHRYGTQLADFVHVTGEIGVGGGLVLGGEVFRGVHGFAGELGHLLVDAAGPECSCGNRGCLEQLAGQATLLRLARADSGDDLVARAERGQRRALDALASAGTALGVALGGVINVVDIPAVVLGGFYARIGRWLLEPLAAELSHRVVSREPVELYVSSLGSEAATLGAAGLVLRQLIAQAGSVSSEAGLYLPSYRR
jgi:predicted NBD/HSP70 family sugar kinase